MRPDELTKQQEHFAQLCVTLCNVSAAYRQAYDVKVGANFRSIHQAASNLQGLPHVAARIIQLRDEAAAAAAIPSLLTRMKELREMESADAREICGVRRVNCRHCHGIDFRFQWVDDVEYAQAAQGAFQLKLSAPDMSGGFGFNGLGEPTSECPKCFGEGVLEPYFVDVTKLSSAARRLFKGVKIGRGGQIEVLLHDQMQARDQLNRIMGAYKDGAAAGAAIGAGANSEAATIAPDANDETASRSYLQMIGR